MKRGPETRESDRRDMVIVGAGPAGMAAAIVAVQFGLCPVVIDEHRDVGGQIYRRPPPSLHIRDDRFPPSTAEQKLRAEFEAARDRIELWHDTKVWGVFPERRLAVLRGGAGCMVDAEQLVLATGAYEYVPPFPGWTLPGVMTAGGAQQMVKTMAVLPGKRALVVGTGPFLLVVAGYLHRAGMQVAGIVDPVTRGQLLRVVPSLVRQGSLLREALQLLRNVRRAAIPVHRGCVLLEAKGEQEVCEALIAPCDTNWSPDRSRAQSIPVDTICVGYGFVPRTQLAQLAGCRMQFAGRLGGWVPEVDENLETTVPGVWVAGDGAGVAGAAVAQLEGRLVGLGVARRLGALAPEEFEACRRALASRLQKLQRFRAALDRVSQVRPGLSSLATSQTVVCRCEELTREEIDQAVAAGCTDLRSIKVVTRLGMGLCQGRMCWPAMARYVAAQTGKSIAEVGPLRVRPPIRPVCLGDLVSSEAEGAEQTAVPESVASRHPS